MSAHKKATHRVYRAEWVPCYCDVTADHPAQPAAQQTAGDGGVLDVLNCHAADLRRTAEIVAGYGPFKRLADEIRIAADEVEEAIAALRANAGDKA